MTQPASRRRYTVTELALALQLVSTVALIELQLRLVSLPRLVRWVRGAAISWWGRRLPLGRRGVGRARLLQLAGSAARLSHGSNACLRQSLLRLWLLLGEGEEAELVIGVRRDAAEPFGAHAWVEHGQLPVNEPAAQLARYAELVRY